MVVSQCLHYCKEVTSSPGMLVKNSTMSLVTSRMLTFGRTHVSQYPLQQLQAHLFGRVNVCHPHWFGQSWLDLAGSCTNVTALEHVNISVWHTRYVCRTLKMKHGQDNLPPCIVGYILVLFRTCFCLTFIAYTALCCERPYSSLLFQSNPAKEFAITLWHVTNKLVFRGKAQT